MGYRTISINGNKIDTISIFDASKKIGQYDISKNNTQISGNGGQNAFDTKYLVPGTRSVSYTHLTLPTIYSV